MASLLVALGVHPPEHGGQIVRGDLLCRVRRRARLVHAHRHRARHCLLEALARGLQKFQVAAVGTGDAQELRLHGVAAGALLREHQVRGPGAELEAVDLSLGVVQYLREELELHAVEEPQLLLVPHLEVLVAGAPHLHAGLAGEGAQLRLVPVVEPLPVHAVHADSVSVGVLVDGAVSLIPAAHVQAGAVHEALGQRPLVEPGVGGDGAVGGLGTCLNAPAAQQQGLVTLLVQLPVRVGVAPVDARQPAASQSRGKAGLGVRHLTQLAPRQCV
mmetsp:Transcript_42266/g.100789  ORF Transcript_42266/g.100789 Transcript_42266/m.100789 type:complete len:273 (+) Transcript_42266:391-1209(+)